jgi:hypothetical protein
LEVTQLVKDSFDKGELKHELEHSGFPNSVVDDIAERVNDRKSSGWTMAEGREATVKEIEMYMTRTKQSFDNFKEGYLMTGQASTTSSK